MELIIGFEPMTSSLPIVTLKSFSISPVAARRQADTGIGKETDDSKL